MFNYKGIPLHPIALSLIFIIGLVWLFYIILNQLRYKDVKERLIEDTSYIFPVLLLGASSSGIFYLIFSGALNDEIMGNLISQLF